MDGLKKQHNKLKERAQQREADLGSLRDKLTAFNDDVEKATANLDTLLETLAQERPIGGEVKAIQQHQDDFKVR